MAKKSTKKQYQINDAIRLDYWNEREWEFSVDHTTIDEETSDRYLTLAAMLVATIQPQGVPQKRIKDFIGMCREAFAL